jgi:hypothetical protein
LPEFAAVQLAEQANVGRLLAGQALPGGRWLLNQRLDDLAAWGVPGSIPHELLVVDDALRPVWRLRPPPEPVGWHSTHAMADDLSLAALALPREVRLVAPDGRVVARLPYPTEHQAGFAAFTTAGTLQVRFPGRHELLEVTADLEVVNRHRTSGIGEAGGCMFTADRRWLWVCVPEVGELGCALWLVRVAGRRVVDRRLLGLGPAQVVRFHRHPDGHSICLAVSGGADYHEERWARHEDERIVVWPPPGPDELTAIHPGGQEYLTMHGWEEPEELTRRRWPDGLVLARLPLAAVAPSAASLGAGQYLTGELVLATVGLAGERFAHLLLSRAPLRPLGWVRYPGHSTLPGGLGPCRDGTWLTLNYRQTPTTVRRWTLAEPPTPVPGRAG